MLCIHVCKPIGYLQLTDWRTKLCVMIQTFRRGLPKLWAYHKKCIMTVSQLRTIQLLNMEGKILLSVNANRTTRYMLTNNNFDIAVRTGGVPDASGCIEHTSIPKQISRQAREEKVKLAIILVRSYQCIWIYATQPCAASLGEVACPSKDIYWRNTSTRVYMHG